MKVTQEKLPDSQIGLEIEISAESSQQSYDEVLKNLARTANIPGFRKGKVPSQILLQRLGSTYVKGTALEPLIQKSLKAAIEQESIEALGNYQLRSDFEELLANYTPGQPLVFSAAIDVPATIILGDYRSLTVKVEEIVYQPEKVDEWFKERQAEKATLVPIEERPAQLGDLAIVNYQAHISEEGKLGEAIAGVQGTDFNVDLEPRRFVEGLVEGIVGLKPEETKEISVIFPEDYPREDLAGQPVIFNLTLLELKEKELPELNDEFAQEVSEFETLAELKASLEKRFQEEAQEETNSNIDKAILEELVKISQPDLPNTSIQEEVTEILTRLAIQFERLGVDLRQIFPPEKLSDFRENTQPEAIKNLTETLAIKEIARQESIEAQQAEIDEKVAELTLALEGQNIDQQRLLTAVTSEILQEKTLKWLRENIENVVLVPEGSLSQEEEDTVPADSQTIEAIVHDVEPQVEEGATPVTQLGEEPQLEDVGAALSVDAIAADGDEKP
jgi:trigger factor